MRSALTTGENLPFNLEVKTAGSVNPADLGAYRVIILNDAPVNQAMAQALIKFVEGGGGLVIATGHTPNRPRSIRSSKISRPPGSKKRFGLPAAEAAITW